MEEKRIIVDVDHVTVRFNLANQKVNNLKEYLIKMVKRELLFQEFFAVRDVNFQIREGEAWGLVGMNGFLRKTGGSTITFWIPKPAVLRIPACAASR